jgi:hypothetical protein
MKATLIVNNAKWLNNDTTAFDLRYETQAIPKGHFVAGLFTENGEMLDAPYLETHQMQEAFDTAVNEARTYVRG